MPTESLYEITFNVCTVIAAIVFFIRSHISTRKLLHEVKAEVKPNGGGSMADAVNRIEEQIHILNYWMTAFQNLYEKPIFKADNLGHNVWANNSYLKLVGASLPEVEGHGWLSYVEDNERPKVSLEWESAVKEGRSFDLTYTLHNNIHNKKIRVRRIAYPIIVKRKLAGYIGTVTEV